MAMVGYVPGALARAMMARALTSSGTRRQGRLMATPNIYAHRNIQPIVPQTSVLSGLGCGCAEPYVPYNAAKLGALGITGTQASTGVKAGVSAGTTATAIGTSVAGAVGAGAAAGSVVPIVGTAIGAIVGLLASGILNRKDPEVANFDQAVAIWQQNRQAALNIANKYLVLAGLFDLNLKNPHIPIYQKYGRMGEQRFVTDMANRIYQAALAGQITAKDTPQTIMERIVQPWIDSWGLGAMVDPHADLINLILLGMVAEYVAGAQNRWLARGGDYPFASLPAFPLQQILARAAAPVPAPPPMVVTPPPPTMLPMPVTVPKPVTPIAVSPPAATVPKCTPPLVWNGTQCVQPTVSQAIACMPPASPNQQGQCIMPSPQAGPPAGFTQVGTDPTTGATVYSNPQGVLYTWNGTAMQIHNGTLANSGGNLAAQVQAAIQQALSQGQSAQQAAQTALAQAQSTGAPITPAALPALTDQAQATATAPMVAGVGGTDLGKWVAMGAGLLVLIFATARPARGGAHG